MDENHIWNIFKDHFEQKGPAFIQLDSYNDFVTRGINEIINKEPALVIEQKDQK